jgi:hypothetical protein
MNQNCKWSTAVLNTTTISLVVLFNHKELGHERSLLSVSDVCLEVENLLPRLDVLMPRLGLASPRAYCLGLVTSALPRLGLVNSASVS